MKLLLAFGILLGSTYSSAQTAEFYEAFPTYVGGRVSNDSGNNELCKLDNIFLGPISEADFAVMRYVPVQSYDGKTIRCFQKRIADILTSAEAFNHARTLRAR